MAKKWFTMKHHGWGWVPISWEGWAVTAALVWYIFNISIGIDKTEAVPPIWWTKLIIGVGIFIFIAYKKGPSPRWRWDKK